jgi:putative sigma-54 modulation protein
MSAGSRVTQHRSTGAGGRRESFRTASVLANDRSAEVTGGQRGFCCSPTPEAGSGDTIFNPNQNKNMQTANVDLHITVTGRHLEITDAIREYARKKLDGLHLDYPRIIEAKVILDVQTHHRHFAEIILFCANHITIECSSTSEDLYAAIDETISKIARRMRKYKTRLLKNHRPRKGGIRHIDEHVFSSEAFEDVEKDEVEPHIVHRENYRIRPLYPDEAITELELSEHHWVIFHNQNSHELNMLFRRKDGDYGLIALPGSNGSSH